MGGAVSAGENNDELVDNLCYESYIITPKVEEVFRKIDRADYMKFDTEDERLDAYDDRALRKGVLHLSAPCIYTKALEALKIERGHSFLNVGSGTGYFSTMVGMLIGPYGVNHGIEIYPENIEFAHMKLKEFKDSSWYDPMGFCEPYFVQGNGLLLSPANRQYDRIYCGAAVPQEHSHLLKNLLNIDGILVMPTEHQLEAVTRTGLVEWSVTVVMPSVTFAPLITPSSESPEKLTTIEITSQMMSLKEMCRLSILSCLSRDNYSLITSLPLPSTLVHYISNGRSWDALPMPPKVLCPMTEEELKQRPNAESEQRGDMFIVDRDQQRYLLVNCRGAVLMQLPLQRIGDEEVMEEDPEMDDYDQYEQASDQQDEHNIDHSEYPDDLLEDQDDDYYGQGNEDEGQQPIDASMESLEQCV